MDNFNEAVFRSKVDSALTTVRTILDTTKHPQRPSEVAHEYEDKYHIVERAARNSATALLVALDILGANADAIDQCLAWTLANKSVTLRLDSFETCKFIKKTTRDVESATKHVVEKESTLFGKSKSVSKTVTTVTEWHWKWTYKYRLFLFGGSDSAKGVELQGRSGEATLVTTHENTPHPESRSVSGKDLNLTWLFKRAVSPGKETGPVEDLTLTFEVDRNAESCHTPRRNQDIESALSFYRSVYSWAGSVDSYFRSVFSKESLDKLDMSSINDNAVFNPVLPLFLPGDEGEGPSKSLLPGKDVQAFFKEQRRSLNAKLQALGKTFPDNQNLTTVAEANLLTALKHAQSIAVRFSDIVNYVEWMIETQLIAAVGKELTPKDFGEYMDFHCRKLFLEQYAPKPFVYAVRRPNMCPEGVLSIEADVRDGSLEQPVNTLVASRNSTLENPMFFQLGAATRAAFVGEQHVHGLALHRFSGDTGVKLRLVARARQFSSFILMLGTMVSGNTFKPTHGIIIQNKDELFLSLMLETIPSAKQFRDAIESLSPEQQRFAKAYRAMQLESTLFAMCVVQIKPQMEKLLNLPNESLIKEIKLTQDLMEMFIKYQIPSDMMSFDGDEDASVEEKVDAVKAHVKALYEVIQESKDKELKERGQEAAFAVMDSLAGNSVSLSRSSAVASSSGVRLESVQRRSTASRIESSGVKHEQPKDEEEAEDEGFDITKLPAELDNNVDKYVPGQSICATTIKPSTTWTKKFQKKLLAKPEETILGADQLHTEKNRAFDLLDALTKSGALPLHNTVLHVVIANTHSFNKTLLHTVTRDNINPIEKAEATAVVMAATINGVAPQELIRESQFERFAKYSPELKTNEPLLIKN